MELIPKELKEFVENNPKLVTRKESTRYPGLFVLKYSRKVFHNNLWSANPLLKECRGLVVDSEYNVVARPFTKIFNYKENGTGTSIEDRNIVFITKKVNGFMASLTKYEGKLLVSTTGSLDSDFVDYATEYLKDIDPGLLEYGHTYMFEICHPSDPHIIPEEYGAHFLAVVGHIGGNTFYKFDFHEDDYFLDALKSYGIHTDGDQDLPLVIRFCELKEIVKTCRHEGFVVLSTNSDETLKIKSPWYLVNKALARKEDIFQLNKERVDEEYYDLVDHLKGLDSWAEMGEQVRLQYIRNYFESQ